jgi:hypothetical protein
MSSGVETSLLVFGLGVAAIWASRDLMRSHPVRSAFGLPVYLAGSPSRSILHYALLRSK